MEMLSTNTYHLFSAILFLSVICCLGAQGHPPQPSLTVSPAVIRERETVMLSCETSPSLSVDKCYFTCGDWKELRSQNHPCHKRITGTDILSLTGQRLPAQVKLQCYYTANGWSYISSYSAFAFVTIMDHPSLTVRPAVIRETDSVQLICETPPSLSVSQCYIDLEGRQNPLNSCQQSIPGTTLLSLTGQSSPAEVKVRCNYNSVGMSAMSPFSDPVSITILGCPPQPSLTVSPAVIREREAVMLSCDIPPSLSVDKCYFTYGDWKELHSQNPPCHKLSFGTAILRLTSQRLPAQVKLQCYYKSNNWSFTSSYSASASITIKGPKPVVTVHRGENILIICLLPGSASGGTRCSLYMGEEETPFKTTQVSEKKSKKTQQWFCQFAVSENDLLRRLQSVSRKEVSCDFRGSPEQSSVKSPRSDGYILTDLMVDDSSDLYTTQTTSSTSDLMVDDSSDLTTSQTTLTTSGLTDGTTSPSGTTESCAAEPHQSTRVFCTSGSDVSNTLPPDSRWFPNTGSHIWLLVLSVVSCGVALTLGALIAVCTSWRGRKSHSKRPTDNRQVTMSTAPSLTSPLQQHQLSMQI